MGLVATREVVEILKYPIVHLARDYERLSFDNTPIFWLILVIGALPRLHSVPVEAKGKTTMAIYFHCTGHYLFLTLFVLHTRCFNAISAIFGIGVSPVSHLVRLRIVTSISFANLA